MGKKGGKNISRGAGIAQTPKNGTITRGVPECFSQNKIVG